MPTSYHRPQFHFTATDAHAICRSPSSKKLNKMLNRAQCWSHHGQKVQTEFVWKTTLLFKMISSKNDLWFTPCEVSIESRTIVINIGNRRICLHYLVVKIEKSSWRITLFIEAPDRSTGKMFLHVLFSSTQFFKKISYLLVHSYYQVHAWDFKL